MGRTVRFVALAVLAGFAVACQDQEVIQVRSLKFIGVRSVSQSELRDVLATRVSSRLPWGKKAYFDRARFDQDLKRIQTFYIDRGYNDARVTGFDVHLNQKQDAVDLTVTVSEGTPVRVAAVDLVGFEVLPKRNFDALRREIPLKVGQPRDRQLVLTTHQTAVNMLRDHGYPYATVSVHEEDGKDSKSASLTFTANPGQLAYFGPVQIHGNERVSDNVIRHQLAYNQGDLYRRSLLQETQRRLFASQLFQFATVAPTLPGIKATDAGADDSSLPIGSRSAQEETPQQPIPADEQSPIVPTTITVAEGKHQRMIFGVGYGTEEKARVDAQYRILNFLGDGRTGEAHARWSSLDRGVRFNFNQPYLFAPGYSFGALGQLWYTYTPAYRAQVSGGSATVTRRVNARTYVSLSMASERDSSTIEPSVAGNVQLRNDLIALGLNPVTGQQVGTLNSISLTAQWSTSNNPLNATRGFQLTGRAEQAGLILPGTFKYTLISGDARHYWPFGSSFVWANRAQFGNISPASGDSANVPFGKRFFLGGSTSIRGWGIYEVGPLAGGLPIGGDSMFAFTSEMREHIRGNLGSVFFLDGGNVWENSFQMQLNDLRFAVGAGVRYQTLVGPVRFDFGYQLNPEPGLLVNGSPQTRRWRVHFSVGQAF